MQNYKCYISVVVVEVNSQLESQGFKGFFHKRLNSLFTSYSYDFGLLSYS